MLRIAVIGARRRRQGIGEFVARALAAAGAEICAVIGTSDATVDEARRRLRSGYGIDCRGSTDLGRVLTEERPDAVAICSPYTLHEEHLRAVANASCHCLCEKPLWWAEDRDRARVTRELVGAFAAKGLHLGLVTQWPYTLDDFYRMFPDLRGAPVTEFRMHLGPMRTGEKIVLDAAPHPLSMLQRMLGYGVVAEPKAELLDRDGRDLRLDFRYEHQDGGAAVSCRFTTTEEPPRPAGYSINGRSVERRIRLPGYELWFEASGTAAGEGETTREETRSIRIGDPLDALARDFVGRVERRVPTDTRGLFEGMAALEQLVAAVRRERPRRERE